MAFQSATGFKIGGNAGGAEGMAPDHGARAKIGGAALGHAPDVNSVHWLLGHRRHLATLRTETAKAFLIGLKPAA